MALDFDLMERPKNKSTEQKPAFSTTLNWDGIPQSLSRAFQPKIADEISEQPRDNAQNESQLNVRMAQFETLVRNTKLSLQAKLEESQRWQQQIEEKEEQLKTQKLAQDERFRLDRNQIETEKVELAARKTEIEERLAKRERELQVLVAGREKELTACVNDYRKQLEEQLNCKLQELQERYEKRQMDLDAAMSERLESELEKTNAKSQELEIAHRMKISLLEKQWEEKKRDAELRVQQKMEELQIQNSSRMEDAETNIRIRRERIEEELEHRTAELEMRLNKRDEQLQAREQIIRESEDEWKRRRESFEAQWNEYESMRKQRADEFVRRDAKLQERELFAAKHEENLNKMETQIASREESLRIQEHQISLAAEKYAKLKEMEIEALEGQAESARIREGLVRERLHAQKTLDSERLRLRDANNAAVKQLEDERKELARQNHKMEQMRLALDRSREDLGKMHRETLEIRLATEELWLQLCAEADQDKLLDSLENIRSRITEQYRDAAARLDLNKEEIKLQKQQSTAQLELLHNRRDELQQWVQSCEDVFKQKEQELIKREQEVEKRQKGVDDLVRQCRHERQETEKTVKFLQEQMHSHRNAA